jgi:hypothetical protein
MTCRRTCRTRCRPSSPGHGALWATRRPCSSRRPATVAPDDVDALRFEWLVAAGDIEEGLELWRGPALDDVGEFAAPYARRLTDLRLGATVSDGSYQPRRHHGRNQPPACRGGSLRVDFLLDTSAVVALLRNKPPGATARADSGHRQHLRVQPSYRPALAGLDGLTCRPVPSTAYPALRCPCRAAWRYRQKKCQIPISGLPAPVRIACLLTSGNWQLCCRQFLSWTAAGCCADPLWQMTDCSGRWLSWTVAIATERNRHR